jgi:catechol 2,3-dioxygenase-like lactoylglutathione lyase family enzyme
LRMSILQEFGKEVTGDHPVCGIGADGKPFLWISGGGKTSPHTHICIRAETRAQVDAFYKAGLAAGGKDNGAPGLRPHYHPNYYGAFVLDPEGHNVEAVCHNPE